VCLNGLTLDCQFGNVRAIKSLLNSRFTLYFE
jgi:hypothetical protein